MTETLASAAGPAVAVESPAAAPEFGSLALDARLLKAVAESGYTRMTPIQAKAIPVVLAGRDVMGAAQTGTGKTAAFTLPLLQKMMQHENASMSPARHPVRALVLAPTRELADQVAANVKKYAQHTALRSAVVFGGVDMKPQTEALRKGVEVLIATPGRLLDHIESKVAVLGQVEYVVLDEADRMLDIGFLPDLQRILSYLPKQRQTLLFSATFSPEIKRLAESYLQSPITVEVARPNATASTVEQRFVSVAEEDKRGAVKHFLRERTLAQAIVFVNSKLGAARLARAFERDGLKTQALHGDKSQDERLKALAAFKRGEVDLLVATDVAARGLDIADLPAVFNFDVPFNAEDYVHRIGRTGRAGASGLAVTLVARDDSRLVADIEKLIKKKIELEPLDPDELRPRRTSRRYEDDEAVQGGHRGHDRPEPDSGRAARSWEPNPSHASRSRAYGPVRKAASDPFFDKPYEPSGSAPAAWESGPASAAPGAAGSANGAAASGATGSSSSSRSSGGAAAGATPGTRPGSPNIRPKRKVASLLGG